MQAFPFRSMSKTKLNSHKTDFKCEISSLRSSQTQFHIHRRAVKVALLFVLVTAPHALCAQQSAATKPCSDPPCAGKTNSAPLPVKVKERVSETLVDGSIPDDPALERIIKPYRAKVRALEVVIGKLEGDLTKEGIGAGTLGSFVTDAIRAQASAKLGKPVLLAITNSGGLRKNSIAAGQLRAADIFELLPFENALIEIDLTGEQLLKLLGVVVSARDAQSGARINYRLKAENRPELVSVRLVTARGQEIEINPKATYTIVTIDYLLNLASGNYAILQQGKNAKPLGVTLRDAVTDYVKAQTVAGRPIKATLDGRFVSVGPDGSNPGGAPK